MKIIACLFLLACIGCQTTDTVKTEQKATDTQTQSGTSEDFTYVTGDDTISTNIGAKNAGSVNVYELLQKDLNLKSQQYTINHRRDTTIACAKGTKITIKANSLTHLNGAEVNGKVNLEIKEAYNLSDMLLHNLTTTSDGKILESGGMIYVHATDEGKELKIKAENTIEIQFAGNNTSNSKEMYLFNGERNQAGDIDWEADIVTTNRARRMRNYVIKIYSKDKGQDDCEINDIKLINDVSLRNYLRTELSKIPLESYNMNVGFKINQKDELENFEVKKSGTHFYMELLKVFNSIPPITQESYCLEDISSSFKVKEGYFTVKDSIDPDRQKEIENEQKIESFYFSTKLGWINRDAYHDPKVPEQNLFVNIKKIPNTNIKLIFHSFKAILNPTAMVDSKVIFKGVPKKEIVTIIAIKYEKGKYYFAKKDKVFKDIPVDDLSLKEMTAKEIQVELESFN